MLTPEFSMAFMAGILGSGHCLGMCGGLVSAFFMGRFSDQHRWVPHGLYHGARLFIYFTLGVLAGWLGLILTSSGLVGKAQAILQILAGLLVIFLGLEIMGLKGLQLGYDFWPFNRLSARFMKVGEKGALRGAIAGGVLNGLMPCSLTLAMVVQATTSGGAQQGGTLMLAFGAGTLPAMLFVGFAFHKLGIIVRGWLLKIAALFIVIMGLQTLWQGLTFFSIMRLLGNG
ncbi:sulfite exporter TauE/SafE family protein [Magnetococcus sp. PR-3]|uniref:sulfite exporter TauE/SafE family protein n=1 Tax=Magnetococcus sp. PR-3 TaxID=3120355 RepID=UPI002FCE0022